MAMASYLRLFASSGATWRGENRVTRFGATLACSQELLDQALKLRLLGSQGGLD